jgi:hypothetical protein
METKGVLTPMPVSRAVRGSKCTCALAFTSITRIKALIGVQWETRTRQKFERQVSDPGLLGAVLGENCCPSRLSRTLRPDESQSFAMEIEVRQRTAGQKKRLAFFFSPR